MAPILHLRDITESDLPIFFEFERDPEAVRMAAFTAKDPNDRAAFDAHWARILADPTVFNQTILLGEQVVGSVLSYQDSGHVEVSYWIDRPFWGQGIATQALQSFLRLQTVRPIYARAAKDNLGSIRVLEKCGFTVIEETKGFANARGQEIEEVLMELKASTVIPTSFGSLRPWQSDDLPALVKYANNRRIWLNLRDGFPHPYTEEAGLAFLNRNALRSPPTNLAIATPEEAIGSVGLSIHEDVHRLTAEMGYWLAEPYWGKGIMSETVSKITEYAFEQLGLVRVYAEPYAHNLASCRVLEKAGYALEGRMRKNAVKDGQIIDMFLYAKVKE